MNNTIEFVLRMKDIMSSSMAKVGSNSQSVFSKMAKSADQVTGRNKILGMSFNELESKIKQVENTISSSTIPSQIAAARRELATLQKQSNNHVGNLGGGVSSSGSGGIGIGGVAVGNIVGNMVTGAITMGAQYIREGVSEMINQSFQKEQAITGLTTFLGKKGAIEAYRNIRKDANATPYDVQSLLEVNRALISTGLDARSARFDTMNLANAVAAVGGGNDILSRMAVNMQQIKTVGKATAIDIRQFGIAGINIYEMLARSLGKNIAQVKEMDVTYEQLSEALAMANSKGGIYDGALLAQSQTKSGKWNTFKDNVKTGLSDIGDAFSPVILKMLDLGIKFAEGITPMLEKAKPYIDWTSNGIGKMVDYVTQLQNGTGAWSDYLVIAKNYTSMIWNFLKFAVVKTWELVASILDFISKSEILKDVFRVIGALMEGTFRIIKWMVNNIIWLWENVLKPILNAIDAVYKWIKGTDDVKIRATKTIINKKPDGTPSNSPLGAGGAIMASNSASGKAAGDTVAGAGPKTVNIHVGKFFDSIQFTTMDAKESAQELENVVMEVLARVLYNGAKTV